MYTAEYSKLLHKSIQLLDTRTGCHYTATIQDVKEVYGKTRLQLKGCDKWFEPTAREMSTVC